jgi:uncharacterized protein YigE (DUF2233 family)
MLLHFLDLVPIHNHAYNPVGIYSEKTRYKSCISHDSSREQTMALYLNIVFYIKLQIPQVLDLPDFSLSGMSVHFILYGKDKIQMVGNPNPYTHTLSKP